MDRPAEVRGLIVVPKFSQACGSDSESTLTIRLLANEGVKDHLPMKGFTKMSSMV